MQSEDVIQPLESNIELRKDIKDARANTDKSPSEAAISAGNYRKGKFKWYGYTISIENPKGSTRSGVDESGRKWVSKMYYDYGYFLGHSNSDGAHLDVFVGDNPAIDLVHVIDQTKPNGKHDEYKCVIGAHDKKEALDIYLKNYEKGWKNYKGVEAYTLETFKDFTEKLDKKNPLMNKTGAKMGMIKISTQSMRKAKSSDPTPEESAWAILAADEDLWKPYVKRTDGEISDDEYYSLLRSKLPEIRQRSLDNYAKDISKYRSLPPEYTEDEIKRGVRSGRVFGSVIGGAAGGLVGGAVGLPISMITRGSALPYSLLGMLGGSIYLGKTLGDIERDRYKRNPLREVPNKDDFHTYPLLSNKVYDSYMRDLHGKGDGKYLDALNTADWLA